MFSKITCTKCGGTNCFLEQRKEEKSQSSQTMDDWLKDVSTTLLYTPIVMTCKDCGYSVTK